MGWERKRGKLHEFNRLLRGQEHYEFVLESTANRRAHRQGCAMITLDANSRLPIGSAARGTAAHPLEWKTRG